MGTSAVQKMATSLTGSISKWILNFQKPIAAGRIFVLRANLIEVVFYSFVFSEDKCWTIYSIFFTACIIWKRHFRKFSIQSSWKPRFLTIHFAKDAQWVQLSSTLVLGALEVGVYIRLADVYSHPPLWVAVLTLPLVPQMYDKNANLASEINPKREILYYTLIGSSVKHPDPVLNKSNTG